MAERIGQDQLIYYTEVEVLNTADLVVWSNASPNFDLEDSWETGNGPVLFFFFFLNLLIYVKQAN